VNTSRKGLLEVRLNESDGRYVVTALGELDGSNVELLGEAISDAEDSRAELIIVDLSRLTFMDSSGLHLILEAHARSQADSDRMRFVRGPRSVQRVFELTGVESELPFIER
jgi:stage II sporulation protein AA (anti-sigma F factor antagonist)